MQRTLQILSTNICNAHCARFSIRPDFLSAHSLRQPFYAAKAAPLAQFPPWADSPGPLPPRTNLGALQMFVLLFIMRAVYWISVFPLINLEIMAS